MPAVSPYQRARRRTHLRSRRKTHWQRAFASAGAGQELARRARGGGGGSGNGSSSGGSEGAAAVYADESKPSEFDVKVEGAG